VPRAPRTLTPLALAVAAGLRGGAVTARALVVGARVRPVDDD
jgi:hypothetical protein